MSEMTDLMIKNISQEVRMQKLYKDLSKANLEQVADMQRTRTFIYLPQCEKEG